ncbi:hypothetical protein ACFY8N_29670 [Streptomyces collinus]|uniref:hypothetical protein n=1 Tax=Streptomyces collinus TaxID=42684 RepID=UPI0036AF43CF
MARKPGLPPDMVAGIAWQEVGGQPGILDTVETALQDPVQNIFIASEYLAQLKAESEFRDVPAEEMTPAQYQELAACYNGGPYWETDDAQDYGRGFAHNLDEARNALR